tara:strand:+ start:705 stop:866 length:162 start_codon:yes stop_codon:yes gene_type:complete
MQKIGMYMLYIACHSAASIAEIVRLLVSYTKPFLGPNLYLLPLCASVDFFNTM